MALKRYQDLARELRKIWNKQVKVIHVIIGALGTMSNTKTIEKEASTGIETKAVEL